MLYKCFSRPSTAPSICGFLQGALEGLGDLGDEFLLVAARALQFPFENLVAVRVQRAKPKILEFQLDGIQSQALGDRRVDLERFAGAAPALDRRHDAEGAHVVHAVGELDHDDADVAHHRQQHFAKALGLRFLPVLELDLVQLADAVDQFGHHLPENGGDLGLGRGRIFDDIVQDGRDQGVRIQTQIREDVGNRDRVRDVRFARYALLSLMLFSAEIVGFAHPLDLGGG